MELKEEEKMLQVEETSGTEGQAGDQYGSDHHVRSSGSICI